MRSLKVSDSRHGLSLDLRIADLNIRIDAPERVLTVLDATLSRVPRFDYGTLPELTITANPLDEVWEIESASGGRKIMGRKSALPQIAGAIVSSAVGDTATARNLRTLRATVVEKDGRALAMIGDDWESALTVAAHLHTRGWMYIGSDNALFDPLTLEVFPMEKSLYVNSSSLMDMPLKYRVAVEASPWYVTPQGIAFYAVDPTNGVTSERVWSQSARLSAVMIVDGAMTEQPSLETVDRASLRSDRLARMGVDFTSVNVADLRLGGFVQTCDVVEHWFASILT